MESTLTVKGQITLPKRLRESLHLKAGDKVVFEESKDGGYYLKPKTLSVQSLKGCVSYSGEPITLEDMQRAIEENVGS
jgi:AbrB family looped-hinge helix DNA binding protein